MATKRSPLRPGSGQSDVALAKVNWLTSAIPPHFGYYLLNSVTEDDGNVVHVSSLTRVEIVSALTRRFRRGDITQAEFDLAHQESQLDIANQSEIVWLSDLLIDEAVALAKIHGLRAYDAVQLSAALDTGRVISQIASTRLILVSADNELNAAALAEGLQIEDPNTH